MKSNILSLSAALLFGVTVVGCSGTMRSERVNDDRTAMDYPVVSDNNPQALDDPALSAHGSDGAAMSHEFSAPDATTNSGTMGAEIGASTAADATFSASGTAGTTTSDTGVTATASVAGQPIDLNLATVEQLDALPGIERNLAESIVAFRNRAGTFRTIDDLLMVQGMTSAKLEKIRSQITVGQRGTGSGSDTMPLPEHSTDPMQ